MRLQVSAGAMDHMPIMNIPPSGMSSSPANPMAAARAAARGARSHAHGADCKHPGLEQGLHAGVHVGWRDCHYAPKNNGKRTPAWRSLLRYTLLPHQDCATHSTWPISLASVPLYVENHARQLDNKIGAGYFLRNSASFAELVGSRKIVSTIFECGISAGRSRNRKPLC